MYRIKCLNAISEVGLALLTDNYELVDDIQADAILVRSANVQEEMLQSSIAAIARAGAGVNNIPVDKCSEQGIVVFNTPGANANAVKELVIGGLLLASRDIIGGVQWVNDLKGKENIAKLVEKGKGEFTGPELFGKKLGVIGLGAIGAMVANAGNRLGMNVYGFDPFISVESAWNLSRDIRRAASLEEIFSTCDYITLHVPLIDETKGIINKDSIETMKDGVRILNFSRDALVVDEDMKTALASGKISCYVTDFPNNDTVGTKGIIAIPHLGASTPESEDNCANMAVLELMDYLENGNIKNSVNYAECNMGICSKIGRITIHHKNIPNMIGQFTAILASVGVNISDMLNKSKGNYAYTIIDVETKVDEILLDKIKKIDGVVRVRLIENKNA